MIFRMRPTNLLLNLMDEKERERERERERGRERDRDRDRERRKSSCKVLQEQMNNETLEGYDRS